MLSLPSRERGLKRKIIDSDSNEHKVAPFAGAWIETTKASLMGMI